MIVLRRAGADTWTYRLFRTWNSRGIRLRAASRTGQHICAVLGCDTCLSAQAKNLLEFPVGLLIGHRMGRIVFVNALSELGILGALLTGRGQDYIHRILPAGLPR